MFFCIFINGGNCTREIQYSSQTLVGSLPRMRGRRDSNSHFAAPEPKSGTYHPLPHILYGWGTRIRTWDHGSKPWCLTAWLYPIAFVGFLELTTSIWLGYQDSNPITGSNRCLTAWLYPTHYWWLRDSTCTPSLRRCARN